MINLGSLLPEWIAEKINTPEVTEKIKKLFAVLTVTRKAEVSTDHFRIFAWTETDAQRRRSVIIRIQEEQNDREKK